MLGADLGALRSAGSASPPQEQQGVVDVVQLLSHVRLFETPWTTAHQASLSFSIS